MVEIVSDQTNNPNPKNGLFLLRRAEQWIIGCSVFFCILSIGLYFVQQGRLRGRLIEIDRSEPLTIDFQVDINQALWPELTQLPNVGETLACRIVEFRDRHGRFHSIEDLERIEGIGPRTIKEMRPFLLPPTQASSSKDLRSGIRSANLVSVGRVNG